ncbi:uncharacterized protein Z519_06592 [Cladophialophora bantiana CBS 173.52]|uniref:Transcription factor domain-containing protein n=1 Tax=Cladophialophora bantiana (strain ATCC 10958 / CBS 173.52 / CDC B-1940 / NIH 8579) TaxID=1442370 RepID=A0A0D2I7C2_CLAB1|nr:uncharacterized protein Z519_06592 [Cladophialophora bantiana CBS 173.52]KIW92744.1 hypothetical protein Z519_06592 [Cladophialophora bantiana CBS 173.52]
MANICDGCSRRGTSCISQELPDEPGPKRSVEERLSRLETLMEKLIDSVGPHGFSDNSARQPLQQEGLNRKSPLSISSSGVVNSVPCRVSYSSQRGSDGDDTLHYLQYHVTSEPTMKQPWAIRLTDPRQNTRGRKELSHILMSAWPSQRDLDLILEVPVEASKFLHGIACSSEGVPSAREILQLHPQDSHPVLLAWKLLSLAKYLQAILPTSVHNLNSLLVDYHSIMVHAVETAHIVTCNEEVIYSIEGIECIMLESLYHNEAGNLRLSLLSVRRGIALAEMMGLHRGKSLAPAFLKPETRLRIKPEQLWFRLVRLDRYLSLLLGLPQGSLDDSFASPEALKDCPPVECLRRIDCVAAGRILQRKEADMIDSNFTQDIDKLLQKAAAFMPSRWWLVPELTATRAETWDALEEVDRLMCQFAHFHVMARLHLPYVIRADQNPYNCVAAVNANREILTRFVSFRSQTSRCYRGILFLAFIASVTICLAHINTHAAGQRNSMTTYLLAHQRMGDRGMIERTLELMEPTSNDVATTRIHTILRHLLLIEDDAAHGGSYYTYASAARSEDELECHGKVSETDSGLRISLPHVGTIQITRRAIEKSPSTAQVPSMEETMPGVSVTGPTVPLNPARSCEELEGHESSSPGPPIPATACTPGDESAIPGWHAHPSLLDSMSLRHYSVSTAKDGGFLDLNDGGGPHTRLDPEVDEFTDDWDLQGVDMTLFDSILHGRLEL